MPRRLLAVARLGPWSAGLCSLLFAALAAATDAPPWLSWSAPPECRNGAEVERRLELLLDRDVNFAEVPATSVKMGWAEERGWAVRVRVALSEGARERQLTAPTCAEAYDLVALSLALILDPDFQGAGDAGAERVGQEAGLLGAGADAEKADGILADGARGDGSEARLDALPAVGAPSEVSAAAVQPEAATSGAAGNDADDDFSYAPHVLSAAASGRVDLSIFPVPEFGGALQAALDWGALRTELTGGFLASESTLLPGARYPVRFSIVLGEIDACRLFSFGSRLRWVICGGLEMGALSTTELGGRGRRARATWFAGALATGPEFLATDGLRAFARARAVVPLLRHDLVLSDGSRVYEFPPVSFQLEVGVRVDLTDFGGGRH